MTDDHCPPTHRTLAGHVLHAVNLAYDEVAVTHLRCTHRADFEVWEARVVCEPLNVAYVFEDECPLEAALAVAHEVTEVLEALRARSVAVVN